MTTDSAVTVEDIEVFADDLNPQAAAETFKKCGALVVRGLMKPYINEIHRDIEMAAAESITSLDSAEKNCGGLANTKRDPVSTCTARLPP